MLLPTAYEPSKRQQQPSRESATSRFLEVGTNRLSIFPLETVHIPQSFRSSFAPNEGESDGTGESRRVLLTLAHLGHRVTLDKLILHTFLLLFMLVTEGGLDRKAGACKASHHLSSRTRDQQPGEALASITTWCPIWSPNRHIAYDAGEIQLQILAGHAPWPTADVKYRRGACVSERRWWVQGEN